MASKKLPAIHPGEVLREEYLVPLGLTPYGLAKAINVPRTRIERLANEHTAMRADTALRLGRYFGVPAAAWMNLQARYDIETTEDEIADAIARSSRAPPDAECPANMPRRFSPYCPVRGADDGEACSRSQSWFTDAPAPHRN